MNDDYLKKIYKQKIKELKKHNELYYDKSKPIISDSEYDKLKNEIIKLEKKNNFLNDISSPNKSVGFKPSKSFQKYQHKVSMLSLSNAFDEEDLKNFEKKSLII